MCMWSRKPRMTSSALGQRHAQPTPKGWHVHFSATRGGVWAWLCYRVVGWGVGAKRAKKAKSKLAFGTIKFESAASDLPPEGPKKGVMSKRALS